MGKPLFQFPQKKFIQNDLAAVVRQQQKSLYLSAEDDLYEKILGAEDPLAQSIVYARIGNYIDFGAMQNVEKDVFLKLFEERSAPAVYPPGI